MNKIDSARLKTTKSNPEWKLNINFESYFQEYESSITSLIEEVKIKEKELYEK